MENRDRTEKLTPIALILVFSFLAAGIITTGYVNYRNYEKRYRVEVEHQLSAIGNLRVGELALWRKERLGDGRVLFGNPIFGALARRYIENPDDNEAKEYLQSWLSHVQTSYDYCRIFLLDSHGVERMSIPVSHEPVPSHLLQDLPEILRSGEVNFLDFYREAQGQPVHLSVVVPILDKQKGHMAIGLLVLEIDPERYLYPFIRSWPTQSRTAETLLVRREGNDVLFLNELKFQKNTALNLRIPLESKDVASVRAALGQEGIVECKDYRGVPVIADVRSVPNSPWFLNTRMDTEEVYAPLRERMWLVVVLVGALLMGAGAAVGLVWRGRSANEQLQSELAERRRAEEALLAASAYNRSLIETSLDPLMTISAEGTITDVNTATEKVTGCSRDELIGTDFCEYFSEPPRAREGYQLAFKDGSVADYELEIRHRDGHLTPVMYNASVYRDHSAETVGLFAAARDITERKHAEAALRRSEEKYRLLFEESFDGLFITSPGGKILDMNKKGVAMFGYDTKEEILRLDLERDVYAHPPDRKRILAMVNAQGSAEYEVVVKKKNREEMITYCALTAARDKRGVITSYRGIIRDITARKRTENIMLARIRLVEYSGSHSLDELLQATLDEVEALTDSMIGFCHFLEADERTLRLQTWSTRTLREMCSAEGKGQHYNIDEAGVWVDCVRERGPVIHNDYSALPHRKGMPPGHAQVIRELVVPVFRGDRIVAIIGVGNKPVAYHASDIETVSLLADLAWDIAERKRTEEEIRASVARLEEAQRVARIGSWELDLATNQFFWSDEMYRMFEIEPTEFGRSYEAFLDLIHPEDREIVDRAYTDSLANKTPYEIMHRLKFPDGRIKYVHERAEHSCDAAGVAYRSVGTVQDITELRQVQLRLEDERVRLRTLVETIPDLIWLKNPDGVYLTCNPRFERFFGAKEADIVGKTDYDFVDADLADFFREHDRKAMAADQPSINEEWITFADDGHRELLETIKTPMYDRDNSLIGVLGIARNITATRRAEEAQNRLATAIEQAAETVVITDIHGTIQYVNPAFEKVTGYTRQEALGQNPRILKSGAHDTKFYKQLWDTIRAGRVWSGRFTNKTKKGILFHEEATISPVKDVSGEITNFVAVKRDITEHLQLSKQLEQAQKMEAVGTLAGGVAHDFNNLLQVILGYSELVLADEALPDRLRDDLGKVILAGRNGADLVQRLLMFSRKTETRPLDLDLNQRIRQTQRFLQRTIPKMIDIQLILGEDLGGIHADPTQIDQVLMNLAVNARDAMPEGGKLVIETANVFIDEDYARSHLEAKPGPYVLLCVSDTGSGIDKETLEHIFEPFYTTKGPGQGTGLGLAMVFGIVKHHQGFIKCYSEVGHGTTFKIYLPAIIPETGDDHPVVSAVPQGGTETILLVDDEELVRILGKRILERSGYTVLTAANGKEALDLYKKEKGKLSLVILDLIMPEMGGRQCLEELLKIDPKARVLISSGFAANGQTREALQTGARGFVGKPYNMKQVLRAVREVLDEQ